MNEGRIEQVGTPDQVYQNPRNPFVLHFLGNVNRFRGRADSGQVTIGPLTVAAPEHAEVHDAPAFGFVRPHELEVARHRNGAPTIEATVRHVATVGPVVRLELTRRDTGEPLEAEVTRERFEELDLQAGEDVHLTPRRLQVFLDEEDYSI
jgi:sulfate transport system ATP-binding protein